MNRAAATAILKRLGRLAAATAIAAAVAGFAGHAWTPLSPAATAHAASDAAQKIADHFSGIKTMAGEFVQFGPRGEQTSGKFYIQRPGKVRFNYEGGNFQVTSDGKSVVLTNQKMKTADLYPLSKTPLKLLLDERIDLSGKRVQKVTEDPDLTTIVLADKSVFGNSRITMMFDPKSYDLRQWTITDAQGKDTTVMVFNVQNGVKLDRAFFEIDYAKISDLNQAMGQR